MNFGEIKTAVLNRCKGIPDVTASTIGDDINAAQDRLDRMFDYPQKHRVTDQALAVNGWYVVLSRCIALERIRYTDSTGEDQGTIDHATYDWILNHYPELGDEDSDGPLYWAYDEIEDSTDEITIIVMPPTDEAITLNIRGEFLAESLSDSTDTSYWTSNHPNTLILMTMVTIYENRKILETAERLLTLVNRQLVEIDQQNISRELSMIGALR